jgi:TonB family protein
MPVITVQAIPLWPGAREEDRRFGWILAQTLAFSLAIGVIAPSIRIPQPEAEIATELPPRRVRLLAERPGLATKPVSAPPAVTAPPKAQTEPRPAPAAPQVTPRQKAARSGVLALGDALSELQASAPQISNRPRRENADAGGYAAPGQPSTLTANVTTGSAGIAGGVAHQSVLGAAGLPGKKETWPGGNSHQGSVQSSGQASPGLSGNVRGQEDIQEQLDRHKGAMYTLYNRELRNNASLQGKLVISITIAPAGNVTRCVVLSSELESESLQQQLVALIKRIDFGNKPGATVVTTKIPIELFPQ